MRGTRVVAATLAMLASALCLSASAGASSTSGLPTPGTPAQVAALVASSHKIDVLPSDLTPILKNVADNTPQRYYPVTKNGCAGVTKCVFGDTTAKTVLVLFGDSHAWMWLPALAPVATADHVRLILIWMPGCPAATVSVWNPDTHSVLTACNTFRSKSIGEITKLDPALVLLASRTTNIYGPTDKLISNATWQAGLESTIAALHTKSTAVAVIGDITAFTVELPECIAAYPKHVQRCSVPNPNTHTNEHFAAEQAAAVAEGVPYINPQPWLCTATCSPVIGTMVAYFDSLHVTAVYAEYLTNVWSAAVTPLLEGAS